jgi:c-di-GMP-binding flagellar brake protein YcgR
MNRRQSDRVSAEAIVRIIHQGEVYYSLSADISLGGIKIVCRLSFSKEDEIEIEFSIPQSNLERPVKSLVKVLRASVDSGTHHLHCSFISMSDDDSKRFEEAMNSLIVEAWFISDEERKKSDGIYSSEKRDHFRVPIKMWVINKDVDDHIHLPAENLSIGGMYVITPAKYDIGTILEIAFNLPGSRKKMEAVVAVVNVRPVGAMFGTGLKFIGLSEEDRELLEKVIYSDITARWFAPDSPEKE